MHRDPLIFVSAGEASGDHYGADLIAALRANIPDARFAGLGGTAMEAAGQLRTVRAEDVAFMGITEVVRHVPRILNSYRKLVRTVHRERPQVAVLIDFPDVNFRLAKHCKQLGIPVVWFVSPQLWAWKRKRLRWVQQRVSRMLTIFPFEEAFYRRNGVQADFVGHPLATGTSDTPSREEYASAWQLDPAKQWIALLPGSRIGELRANLPALAGTAALLGKGYEYLLPVAPTLRETDVRTILHRAVDASIRLVRDARSAIPHSRAAAVASGTATVQVAVLGVPFITVYRVSDATFRAAKRLVTYPPEIHATVDAFGNLPIAMPNLVAGRRVTPELLQGRFTPENVAAALIPLLRDSPERETAIRGLQEVRLRLLPPDGIPPTQKVLDAVLAELAL